MKWIMLCREPRLYSCLRIQEACRDRGIVLDILDPNRMQLVIENGCFDLFYQAGESYDKNRPELSKLADYDAVLPRFGTSSTEIGCTVLRHFEAKNTVVLNHATAFALARNKWQSLQQLAAQGLTVPNTNFAGHLVGVKSQLKNSRFPLVAKVLNGSQGNGVMLLENLSSAESVLSTFQQLNEPYLCQQFITESKGKDIRALVLGGKVIAAMERIGSNDEFRANIHQGGTAQSVQLTEQEKALVIKATEAIGLDFAGVDFLRTSAGSVILEVNASPGFEGIEQVNEVDIASEIVKYMLGHISRSKTSGHF